MANSRRWTKFITWWNKIEVSKDCSGELLKKMIDHKIREIKKGEDK